MMLIIDPYGMTKNEKKPLKDKQYSFENY